MKKAIVLIAFALSACTAKEKECPVCPTPDCKAALTTQAQEIGRALKVASNGGSKDLDWNTIYSILHSTTGGAY